VRRFGGFVSQYLGDGVLVYFGYPQAHEDDAERAVRAGLELIAAVAGLNTRASLQTRVGIATGVVVVGDLVDAGGSQMPHIAAMDLFVVPTISFNLLYVLVIVRLGRRQLVWINVTANPTAEWIAQQVIAVRELDATADLASHRDQLMSERGILRFKSARRLERRGQQPENEVQQCNHCRVTLRDSVIRSIRTMFFRPT
jgi:hypothetical protein